IERTEAEIDAQVHAWLHLEPVADADVRHERRLEEVVADEPQTTPHDHPAPAVLAPGALRVEVVPVLDDRVGRLLVSEASPVVAAQIVRAADERKLAP